MMCVAIPHNHGVILTFFGFTHAMVRSHPTTLCVVHTGYVYISHSPSVLLRIHITRNELASLAHSFYTYLKHQLIHLTIIVLLRLRSIYLGFIVVWSFIPRDTLYCRKIHDRPRCGAAQRGRLNYITNANTHVHILD